MTAPSSTSSSGRTSSAARRFFACASRTAPRTRCCSASRHDGEPRTVAAVVDEQSGDETWWRADLPMENLSVSYRWLLAGGDAGYAWLNGRGPRAHRGRRRRRLPAGARSRRTGVAHELRRLRDLSRPFRLERGGARCAAVGRAPRLGRAARRPRAEHATRVVRRRPDGRRAAPRPHRAGRRERHLHDAVLPRRQHTPVRRSSFDHVDPLLGGDEAFASLVRAAHARGLKLVGDLTMNHCGVTHDWFERAAADEVAGAGSLLLRQVGCPHGYAPGSASARCRRSTGAPTSSLAHARDRPLARRRTASTAGASTSRTWSAATATSTSITTSRRGRGERRRLAARRRARSRLPARPRRHGLARQR